MKKSKLLLVGLLAVMFGCDAGQGSRSLNGGPSVNVATTNVVVLPAMTNEWLTIATIGVRLNLPAEWQAVQQPTNFFVQKRARHADHGIEMTAGTFRMDISVEHYAGVLAASLTTNTLEQLDHVARRVHSDLSDLERIRSNAGGRLADSIRQLAGFELIDVAFQDVMGGRQYDLRSQTREKSGRVLYRRDFILGGVAPPQIVQVTYVGPN